MTYKALQGALPLAPCSAAPPTTLPRSLPKVPLHPEPGRPQSLCPTHGPSSLLILYTTAKDKLTTLPEILRRKREVHTRKYPIIVLRSGSAESPQPRANFNVLFKLTPHLTHNYLQVARNKPPPTIRHLPSIPLPWSSGLSKDPTPNPAPGSSSSLLLPAETCLPSPLVLPQNLPLLCITDNRNIKTKYLPGHFLKVRMVRLKQHFGRDTYSQV